MAIAFDTPELLLRRDDAESGPSANHGLEARCRRVDSPSDTRIGVPLAVVNSCSRVDLAGRVGLGRRRLAEQHLLGQTIVKPTALGPVANTDTKLLIYSLFQKGRVLAQDGGVQSLAADRSETAGEVRAGAQRSVRDRRARRCYRNAKAGFQSPWPLGLTRATGAIENL